MELNLNHFPDGGAAGVMDPDVVPDVDAVLLHS
jgi:hypothetical protein